MFAAQFLTRAAPSLILALCASAIFTSCSGGTAPHQAAQQHGLNDRAIQDLLLEASTFFDRDPKAKRVSEAKAISNLLRVASVPNEKLLRRNVAALCKLPDDNNCLLHTLHRLRGLAFTYSNSEPGSTAFYAGVIVRDGRIHLLRPIGNTVMSDRHMDPTLDNAAPERRDLTAFRSQIMTPEQNKANTWTDAHPDPMPIEPPRDPALQRKLLNSFEGARSAYAGPKGDNSAMVAHLLKIASVTDTVAIRRAGEKFIAKYKGDDKAAAVLDPLLELLWGASKVNKRYDCGLRLFEKRKGRLSLTDKCIYFGSENYRWPELMHTADALWERRSL